MNQYPTHATGVGLAGISTSRQPMMDNPPPHDRRPYVSCETDSLENAAADLSATVDELEKRLSPVALLSPVVESPSNYAKIAPEVVLPPLAQVIRNHRAVIEAQAARIRRIMAALEI